MKKIGFVCAILSPIFLWSQYTFDRRNVYDSRDWQTIPMTRFATCVTMDMNNYYIGTTNGILVYDRFKKDWDRVFTVSDGLLDDHIIDLTYDRNTDRLWCVHQQGISYFLKAGERWENIEWDELFGIEQAQKIGVGDRYLWLLSEANYYSSDPSGNYFQEASSEDFEADHVNWAGSDLQESDCRTIHFFLPFDYTKMPDQAIIQDNRFNEYPIPNLVEDEGGDFCMAVYGLGTGFGDNRTWQTDLVPYGPFSNEVRSFAMTNNGIWMGGFQARDKRHAISYWNRRNNSWTYYEARENSRISSDQVCAVATSKDKIWFATEEGLVVYHTQKDFWRTYTISDNLWDNWIYDLSLDEDTLWVATAYGLNKIDINSMVIDRIQLPDLKHHPVYSVRADKGDVWAGTDLGIFHRIPQSGQWQYEEGYANIPALEITSIGMDDEAVWCASEEGIEVYHRQQNTWEGFRSGTDYSGNINQISLDSQVVWVCTDEGVWKYVKEDHRWHQFTVQDGLRSNEVYWAVPDGDDVWFGTAEGLTKFYWNSRYRGD